MSNQIIIPMYELAADGSILPNPVFHRSWDKLHSRCIEYPFAAAHLGDAKKILDVGTAKSDPVWIRWLDSLSAEVYAVDYDFPEYEYKNINFHKADVRKLPFEGNTFQKVLAISVVEHIGLLYPQVVSMNVPSLETDGDIKAVEEIIRVLKPGGELVMTFPFGKLEGLIGDDSARTYTMERVKRFEAVAKLISLDYYEYQYSEYLNLYPEFIPKRRKLKKIKDILSYNKKENLIPIQEDQRPKRHGAVTWRRLPMKSANALNYQHVDGVVCGVWMK